MKKRFRDRDDDDDRRNRRHPHHQGRGHHNGGHQFRSHGDGRYHGQSHSHEPHRHSQTNGAKVQVGTIKWFKISKGYGFIAVEGGKDVFVHITDVERAGFHPGLMQEGRKIQFVLVEARGRVHASDLSLV